MLREYIGDDIKIDGRMIGYQIVTAHDYLKLKEGWSDIEVEEFCDNNYEIYKTINQIMAIKQSCWLLRRTSHSCQSLSDNMYSLKVRLIHELRDRFEYEFDDDFVEEYCGEQR